MKLQAFLFPILLLFHSLSSAQSVKIIKASDVSKYVGDSVTVVGKVLGISQDENNFKAIFVGKGNFAVIIVSEKDFSYDPFKLTNIGELSVTGRIKPYGDIKDAYVMIIYSTKQITLSKKQLILVVKPDKKISPKKERKLLGKMHPPVRDST